MSAKTNCGRIVHASCKLLGIEIPASGKRPRSQQEGVRDICILWCVSSTLLELPYTRSPVDLTGSSCLQLSIEAGDCKCQSQLVPRPGGRGYPCWSGVSRYPYLTADKNHGKAQCVEYARILMYRISRRPFQPAQFDRTAASYPAGIHYCQSPLVPKTASFFKAVLNR
jgi:hypothetical protein